MSKLQQNEENIKVFIRIKPKTPNDIDQEYFLIKISNSNVLSIPSKDKDFSYDYICEEI